jgi:hypothetical protein
MPPNFNIYIKNHVMAKILQGLNLKRDFEVALWLLWCKCILYFGRPYLFIHNFNIHRR